MARLTFFYRSSWLAVLTLAAAVAPAQGQAPLDILYYGNSFTIATGFGSTRSVPDLISSIAVAAGHPAPRNRNASVAGQSLQYHLTSNMGVITTGIVAGESWDFVVLQDFSTQPTHIGNTPLHLTSSLALYQKVAMHSPSVVPVMYETWARGPGHSFYQGSNPSFPGGPAQMQQEVRDGYTASTANINSTVGSNLARYAPVGDAWEDGGFPLNFYASDIYHASNRGSLLNALVLYGTIYGDRTVDDINLSALLTQLNIPAGDGALIAGLANGVLVPEPATATLVGTVLVVALRRRRRA